MYTDGGSRNNPGLAAVGGVLLDGDEKVLRKFSRFIGISTNNVAEYTGLITGLQGVLELGYKEVDCYMDSELVVKQLKGEYKVKDKNMKELFEIVMRLVKKFDSITFNCVPRAKNKEADKLVNEMLDSLL